MKKFKDLIKLPSEAITAMCDGLLKQGNRKNFKIEMAHFGDDDGEKVCFGCAATCTVQQLGKKNFKVGTLDTSEERAEFLGFDEDDLESFEGAIDSLRTGDLGWIFDYLGYFDEYQSNERVQEIQDSLPSLRTYNWKDGLPAYRKAARELKKLGL